MSVDASPPNALDILAPGESQNQSGERIPSGWAAALDLIEEVAENQSRVDFKRSLVEWHLVVRQFRKVECRRLVYRHPDEADLRWHAICLHSLLAMGQTLELWARGIDAQEDIEACVEDLRLSLREWHHSFTAAEIKKAAEVIFGGTT